MTAVNTFLLKYVPLLERMTLEENLRGEQDAYFSRLLEALAAQTAEIPQLRATEHQKPENTKVWLHYFLRGTDIYVTELDPDSGEGFGFVCLNGDRENAELGYLSLQAIVGIDLMELDLHFDASTTLADILRKYKKL